MKRIVVSVGIGIACLALVGLPVWATASYRLPVTVSNTSGTSYTAIPLTISCNNTALIAGGYISDSALDTRVTDSASTLKHMVASDRTMAVLAINNSGTKSLSYSTGNTPLTAMQIITGYGGYVTIPDAAALELGENFEVAVNGGLNVASGVVVRKPSAFEIVTTASTVTANLLATNNVTQDVQSAAYNMFTGNEVRAGQTYSSFPASTITQVSFNLSSSGSPTGTVYFRIRKVADDSIVTTLGSLNAATLTGGYTWYDFPCSVTTASQDLYFLAEYSGGDAGNYVRVGIRSTSTIPGVATGYISSYSDLAGYDATIKIYYDTISKSVTQAGVTTVEHLVEVTADTTNLKLYIDSVEVDSAALSGASVPNNSNSWVLMTNIPYLNEYSHTVGGTLIAHYKPNTVISGTVLPDLEGAAQNGAITWGTNPENLTAITGIMAPANPAKLGSYSYSSNGTVVDGTLAFPPQMYTELDVSKLPFGDAINDILGMSDTPEALWWFPFIFLGISIFAMLLFDATQRGYGKSNPGGGEGSLLVMVIVIELLLAFFGVLGTQGVSGMIPLWPTFLFPIAGGAIILSRKHYGWG